MARTEYRDLVVSLNVHVTPKDTKRSGMTVLQCAANHADPIIIRYLEQAGREGWEAEDLTSFQALQRLGKVVEKENRGGIFGDDIKSWDFVSVTIRMKRVVP